MCFEGSALSATLSGVLATFCCAVLDQELTHDNCWAGLPLSTPPSQFQPVWGTGRKAGDKEGPVSMTPSLQSHGLSLGEFLSPGHKTWLGGRSSQLLYSWGFESCLPVSRWQFGRGEESRASNWPNVLVITLSNRREVGLSQRCGR